MLRVIDEFEIACFSASTTKENLEHPVFNCGTEQVLESSPELITLDIGEVMDPAIVDSLRTALTTGQNRFTEFVTERIENASKPLFDIIKITNMYTFSNRPPVDLKMGSNKLGSAKANTALVYPSCLCKHVMMLT